MNNFLFPFHRFEVTSSVQLVSVGGFFENLTGADRKIFGAVVGLSGPNDVPDSLDLTTSDLIGTTLINVLLGSGDFSGSLSLGLTPGWYALGFGTGKFGADSMTGIGAPDIEMPSLSVDLSPQLPFTAVQAGCPYCAPPQFINQLQTPRFFAFAVPEPATLTLLAMGVGGILLFAAKGRGSR